MKRVILLGGVQRQSARKDRTEGEESSMSFRIGHTNNEVGEGLGEVCGFGGSTNSPSCWIPRCWYRGEGDHGSDCDPRGRGPWHCAPVMAL